MVKSKKGEQNFSKRQKEDRITKFALKLLSDREVNVFTEMLFVFAFHFANSIFTIVCFYVKHWETFK